MNNVEVTIPLEVIDDLLKLLGKIEYPDVTYCDGMLIMAQQAIRLSRRCAYEASALLYKWAPQIKERALTEVKR